MMIMHGQVIPVALMASAAGHAGRSSPVLGRVVLVAVVVAAVGVFAALQVRPRSGRRSPLTGDRRPRGTQDWRTQAWRTLPPKDESEPQGDTMSAADQEDYGPLWRYGVPLGYGRVYDPGDRHPS